MNIANNDIYRQFRLQDPQEFSLPSDIELLSNAVQQYGHQFNSVYENAPNTKSDSNKLETALSLQTVFNIEPESAMKFAEIGLQAGTVEGKTHEAGYGEAMVQTGKNTYHNFLGGMGYSLYMMTKNEKFKEFADNQNKNVVDLWEDYNWLGNTVLSSIQPLGSQARFMGTTALVQGVPTLVASAFGPAAAKITSLVSGLVAAGINFGMTGLSQQGSEFYQLSKLADQQGHKLDLESPDAMFHFYFGAIAKGGIETVGMELFPGMSFLRKAISPSGIQKVTFETGKKMLAEGFMRTGLGVLVEGGEEFQDSYHSSWQENALKEIANRQGADFDFTSSREMVEQAWKEGLEGAKGMIIPSMLTGLVGGGAYGMRMRAEAKKGFSTPEGSVTVDLRAVKTTDIEFDEAEATGKMEPFRASVVGDALIPVTEEDNRRAAKAKSTGMTAGQAIISDEVFGPQESFVNQAALATGAKLSGDTLVFNTQEEMDRARFLLESVAFATETEGNASSVTLRDSEGNLAKVSLSLIEEGQQVFEPNLTYVEDPEAPYALSRMTQDRAFEWQERQMIKDSIGDIVSHTKGRISNTDLEASVDAIKLVAETLNIPTDQMLKDNLVFKLESASPKSERGYIENISVNGQKQYTIHISDKADATTILHEMGHFLRGTATKEQLSEFSRYYGGDSDAVWIEDVSEKGDKFVVNGKQYDSFEDVMKLVVQNEERFADDFVSYLRTGEAPTEGLQNLFRRMRAILTRFINEFGYKLSPEVRQAFDNLLSRKQGLPYSGNIPTDANGNVLFQQAPNGSRSNLTTRQWFMVRTPEFKAWFGDWENDPENASKVLDENGEPKVVYHNTNEKRTIFDINRARKGVEIQAFFFAPEIDPYGEYGKVRNDVFLNIKNPADYETALDGFLGGIHDNDGEIQRINLQEKGFDGGIMVEDGEVYEYFVFESNQIKSATDNVGTFDGSNPNILFQSAPPTDSEAFNAWFGDSKVVDENGNPQIMYHGGSFDITTDPVFSSSEGLYYFAKDPKIAQSYNRYGSSFPLTEVYLSLKNPFNPSNANHVNAQWVESWIEVWKEEDGWVDRFTGEEMETYDVLQMIEDSRLYDYESVGTGERWHDFLKTARDHHDGFYGYDPTDGGVIAVAFSPNQIKSINNQGTWDAGNPNILYQLSPEAKQQLLEVRKSEVKEAVENFYWIPDDVLNEYIGEPWADNEIRFRQYLKDYPWLLEEARQFTDTDEFFDHLQNNSNLDDYKWTIEDELWFKRIHAYSRIMDPKDKDAQFVRLHTGTDKALIALGKQLRGYEDIDTVGYGGKRKKGSSNRIVYKWGAFKGVSTIVKRLDNDSSADDLQRARELVQNNPRAYRRAVQTIEQAQARVLEARGIYGQGEASREAYYDSLGEEMKEALDEPLFLNEMTDREAAEFLRSTDDKRMRYDARDKLATHMGVLAMERQADAELARLADEQLKTVRYLELELQKAETVGRNLKENLEDRRSRVAELRSQLTEANKDLKKTKRYLEKEKEKEAARRTRMAIEGRINEIRKAVKFNTDTVDASFEEPMAIIARLFGKNVGPYTMLPEQMRVYLPKDMLDWVQQGRPADQWTLGELELLLDAAQRMRLDARVMLEQKKVKRMGELQNIAVQYYEQTYGELPEMGVGYGSVVFEILEDLNSKREQYDENIFNAMVNTITSSIGKMQRLARVLDGNVEGVVYDLTVRKAYERMTGELRESYRRLQEADAKMKELKITQNYLAKDLFTYTTSAGQERTFTRGEVIGLYVYSQNEIGHQKLIHVNGNNIPFDTLADAVGKLSEKDKAWGDYMIDSLGGDEVWERMRDVYYNVYNKNLGRRTRYFTFVSEGKIGDEGKSDLLVGPQGAKIRYVDKDFTKIVNPHAIYPLKLNVTQTFTSQIKKQEHFVNWADWVRDMNYLLTRGSLGKMIQMNHGQKYLNAVQEYVNNVGSPQTLLDDIERLGSKIVSNASVAALSLNFLTMLKQLPSFAAIARGDIGAVELTDVALKLMNPKTHEEAVRFIHEMSPYMLKRAISVEVEKYGASDFDTSIGKGVQWFNENIGMKGIHLMDQAVVNTLWLSAYDTYVRRNPNNLEGEALKQEAAFRATQLISETQPTSIANDLSSLQMKKSPFVRTALLFSNQIFQYINMVWFDLPTSVKAYIATKDKQYMRKAFGTVTNMAISGAMIMLVSGAFFRKDDDDDEKYWKRIRNEMFKMMAAYSLPIVGNAVQQGISGYYGGDLVDLPTAFGRALNTDWTDWDKASKRVWDILDGAGSIGGLPTAFINRTIKSIKDTNPLEMLGSTYGDLWEDWVE